MSRSTKVTVKTIREVIEDVVKIHAVKPGTFTSAQIINSVLLLNPSLKKESVSRALAKMTEDGTHPFIKRTSVKGEYEINVSGKPTATPARPVAPAPKPVVGRTFIAISRDHSGSMASYHEAARKDYNSLVDSIQEGNKQSPSIVTTGVCGWGRGTPYFIEERGTLAENLQKLSRYETPGPNTPLWDSVGSLIEDLKKQCPVPGAQDAFLVMVITDGQDNASYRYSSHTIVRMINELQATDKWTFVFRVPRGQRYYIEQMGIPAGNIQEWELSTRGMEVATQASVLGTQNYFSSRSMGLTSSKSFYTDASAITKKTLDRTLVDISKDVLSLVRGSRDPETIREFIESKTGLTFKKGAAFYQLVKSETVQNYKELLIRDKKSGSIYYGAAARGLLGVPDNHTGDITLRPGNHGDYDIYVQSTSVNRKLPLGTLIMYWDNHGTAYKTGVSAS